MAEAADSLFVEIGADLTPLERAYARGDQATKRFVQATSGDLARVENALVAFSNIAGKALQGFAESHKQIAAGMTRIAATSQQTSRDVSKFGEQVNLLRGQLAGLATNLGASHGMIASLGTASLTAAAGLGAAVLLLNNFINRATLAGERAQRLRDTAETIRLNTDQLQALEKAGAQVGVTAERTTTFLENFSVQMAALREGAGPLYDAVLKLGGGLAEQMQRAGGTAEAIDILAKAYRRADAEQKNLIERAAAGRGGVGIGRLFNVIDAASGLNQMTVATKDANRATQEQVEKWAELSNTIERLKKEAAGTFDTVFTSSLLDNQRQFWQGLVNILALMRSVKEGNFGETFAKIAPNMTRNIQRFNRSGTGVPMPSEAPAVPSEAYRVANEQLSRLREQQLKLNQDMEYYFQLATADDNHWAAADLVRAQAYADKLGKVNEKIRDIEASSKAVASAPLKITVTPKSQERELDPEAIARQWRDRIAILGQAATAAESVSAKEAELNAQVARGGGLYRDLADRALEAYKVHASAADIAQRSMLGIVTQTELWNQKQAELSQALKNGLIRTEGELAQATNLAAREVENLWRQLQVKNAQFPQLKQMELDAGNLRLQLDKLGTDSLNNLSNALLDVVGGTKDAKTAFLDLGVSFTRALNKMALDVLIMQPLAKQMQSAFSGILGGSGTSVTVPGGTNVSVPQVSMSVQKDAVEDAVHSGTESGIFSGFRNMFGGTGGAGGGGMMANNPMMGGLMGVAAVGGAAATGYQSQSPAGGALSGALSGAMAGLMIGGPVGAAIGGVVGGAAGFLGGIFGQNDAEKKKAEEAATAWRDVRTEFNALVDQLSGKIAGPLTQSFMQIEEAVFDMIATASKAGDMQAVSKLLESQTAFINKAAREFGLAFQGTLQEMSEGFGVNGPFAQAVNAVKQLEVALQGFITDAERASNPSLGLDPRTKGKMTVAGSGTVIAAVGLSLDEARRAAQDAALAFLTGAKELSDVERAMRTIDGTATQLQVTLEALGMSADAAATAIAQGVIEAIDDLRESFSTDLTARIRDATGQGFFNDIAELIKERDQMLTDAAALGLDPSHVMQFFAVAAQKIVNESGLAADGLAQLTAAFPELSGVVHRFIAELDPAVLQSRVQSFQDRIFAANIDTSTMGGALAAFDRRANAERIEEAQAGNLAINELETALAAERLNILRDFNDRAIDEQRRAMDEARNFLEGATRRITEYLDHLRAGAESPLSPTDRLASAQGAFNTQRTAALGGNRDALNSITSYANDLLEAARGVFATTTGFQNIFNTTTGQLAALPTQVSAEQYIVNAITAQTNWMQVTLLAAVNSGSSANIATALSGFFNSIDTSVDNAIDFNEMRTALGTDFATGTLQKIFSELDGNGNGLLEKSELIKTATQGTVTQTLSTAQQVIALNNPLNALNAEADWQSQILGAMNETAATSREHLRLMKDQLTLVPIVLGPRSESVNNNMLTALNKIVYNTKATADNTQGSAFKLVGMLAEGGPVTGGVPGKDSVLSWLTPGEMVIREPVARANPWLDRFNRDGQMPILLPPAIMAGLGGTAGTGGAIVRAIGELIAQVDRLTRVTGGGLDGVAQTVAAGAIRMTDELKPVGRNVRLASAKQ